MESLSKEETSSLHSAGPVVGTADVTEGMPRNRGRTSKHLVAVDVSWRLPQLETTDRLAVPESRSIRHLTHNQQDAEDGNPGAGGNADGDAGGSAGTGAGGGAGAGAAAPEVKAEDEEGGDSGVESAIPSRGHQLLVQAMKMEEEISDLVSTLFLKLAGNTMAKHILQEPKLRTFYGLELEKNRPLRVISVDGSVNKVPNSTFLQGDYDVKILCICTPENHPLLMTVKPLRLDR